MNYINQLASLRKRAERALAAAKAANDPEQQLLNLAIFDDVVMEATKLANEIANGQSGKSAGESA